MLRITLLALLTAFTLGLSACADEEGVYGEPDEDVEENGGVFQNGQEEEESQIAD